MHRISPRLVLRTKAQSLGTEREPCRVSARELRDRRKPSRPGARLRGHWARSESGLGVKIQTGLREGSVWSGELIVKTRSEPRTPSSGGSLRTAEVRGELSQVLRSRCLTWPSSHPRAPTLKDNGSSYPTLPSGQKGPQPSLPSPGLGTSRVGPCPVQGENSGHTSL